MAERQHIATFATDKRNGGYLVRVLGPFSNRFAGREVPVTRKDKTETAVQLDRVVWSGKDTDTGKPVSLYTFVPEEQADDIPF